MQSHFVDPGKKGLRWGTRGVGQFYTFPLEKTYELHTEPWEPLASDTFAFDVLRRKLSSTSLDYVVNDNGTVKVIIPYSQKCGYILGWVAWTYNILTEGEEGSNV